MNYILLGLAVLLPSAVIAQEDVRPLSCIEQLVMPGFDTTLTGVAPITVQVTVTVGDVGRATAVAFDTSNSRLKTDLEGVFLRNSRYSEACKGKTLHFEVVYEEAGAPSYYPFWVTKLIAPNRFVVTYHPLKPILN